MQQSEYLATLSSNRRTKQQSSGSNSKNNQNANRDYLENKYANLERQMYVLSDRADKHSKRITFLQQFCIFLLFCCAVLGMLLLVLAL